jgi:hypothetical protein
VRIGESVLWVGFSSDNSTSHPISIRVTICLVRHMLLNGSGRVHVTSFLNDGSAPVSNGFGIGCRASTLFSMLVIVFWTVRAGMALRFLMNFGNRYRAVDWKGIQAFWVPSVAVLGAVNRSEYLIGGDSDVRECPWDLGWLGGKSISTVEVVIEIIPELLPSAGVHAQIRSNRGGDGHGGSVDKIIKKDQPRLSIHYLDIGSMASGSEHGSCGLMDFQGLSIHGGQGGRNISEYGLRHRLSEWMDHGDDVGIKDKMAAVHVLPGVIFPHCRQLGARQISH